MAAARSPTGCGGVGRYHAVAHDRLRGRARPHDARRDGDDRRRRRAAARASSRCCARRSSSTSATAAPRRTSTGSSTRSSSPTCRRSCGRRTATPRRSTRCCGLAQVVLLDSVDEPDLREAVAPRRRASRATALRRRPRLAALDAVARADRGDLRPAARCARELRHDLVGDRSATTRDSAIAGLLLFGWLALAAGLDAERARDAAAPGTLPRPARTRGARTSQLRAASPTRDAAVPRPGRASTIETASGPRCSARPRRRRPARAAYRNAPRAPSASGRSSAPRAARPGILGEGIRQALLRDPTYRPALERRRGAAAVRQVVGDVALGGSPFPPIADYAFLSDCETTRARRAERQRSSGCACRGWTAPSRVRRDARPRRRRLPARARRTRRCPAAAATCPGTMVLETTWGTRTGWLIVRDVLLIGPWHHEDGALAHPPPLAHRLRRRPRPAAHDPLRQRVGRDAPRLRARCSTTARSRPTWEYAGDGYHEAPRHGRGRPTSSSTLTTDLRLGFEGARARARTHDARRRRRLRRAVVVASTARRRATTRPTSGSCAPRDYWHEWLVARRVPRPPVAPVPAAQRADPEGPVLRADRRDDRRGDHLAARDAARRAQLGLPLLAGSATPRSCSGASTRSASTGRPTTSSTSSPTSPAATPTSRSCTASAASGSSTSRCSTTSRATRARGRCGSATAPSTRSSTTSGARCLDSIYLHTKSRDQLPESIWPILSRAGRERDRALARARPRHLGGARRAAALHVARRSCAGSPATAGRGWRGCATSDEHGRALAGRRRRDPRRRAASTASTSAACSCQHYDTDALDASRLLMPLVRFLPADDPRIRRDGHRDRRRADRRRPRPALPRARRPTTASPARRARSRSARSGW